VLKYWAGLTKDMTHAFQPLFSSPSAGTSGKRGEFLPQGEDMSLGLSAGKTA